MTTKQVLPLDLNPGTIRHSAESVGDLHLATSATKTFTYLYAGEQVLVMKAATLIQHPEHGTLLRPAGEDGVGHLHENDPWADATRPVFD